MVSKIIIKSNRKINVFGAVPERNTTEVKGQTLHLFNGIILEEKLEDCAA